MSAVWWWQMCSNCFYSQCFCQHLWRSSCTYFTCDMFTFNQRVKKQKNPGVSAASSEFYLVLVLMYRAVVSNDNLLYSVCVCMCECVCVSASVCVWKEKPGHVPWGDRQKLIFNALYERDHHCLSSAFISRSLSFIFIFLFPLSIHPPPSLVPHSSGSLYLCTRPQH